MATFAGNVNLLVAAPMLQDFLVDKDGTAMTAGTITCYHDNSRTTLKNWYYQTGLPGSYTYTSLPNPLTLSAAGTICDANGVDTIPFFYPYSETDQTQKDPYYITIVNYRQTNQITRENFPFVAGSGGGVVTTENSIDNLIVNGGFWRNILPNTVNNSPPAGMVLANSFHPLQYPNIVAPSQHEGFQYPDIQFIRTTNTSTDTATFIPFPLGNTLPVQVPTVTNTPEYYLNHNCTIVGSGNTQKCYQFPIALHINSLANVPYTISIIAQNDPTSGQTGPGQNVIKLFILQDTGTGTTPIATDVASITLSTAWTQYTFTGVFPGTTGLTLSAAGDDALYLQVQMPLSVTCSINYTKPAVYLTQGIVPTYSYETYDKINSVTGSPRTGDLKTTTAYFYNPTTQWLYGWIPMNDGTIGSNNSNATCRANTDTWPLFNLLWQFAISYDSGANSNMACQMYTSAGTSSPTNYGASALADFTANKQLMLTRSMGRVFMGGAPISSLLQGTSTFAGWKSAVTVSNPSGSVLLLTASPNTGVLALFLGQTVIFNALAGLVNLSQNAIYYVTAISGNSFQVATTFTNAIAIPPVAVTYVGPEVLTVNAFFNELASYTGEYTHTQVEAELAQHHHAGTINGLGLINVQGGGITQAFTALGSTNAVTLATDPVSQSPFTVIQPSTFYNVLIKL